MEPIENLTKEINELNQRLNIITNQNRFMVYTTKRGRFALANFLSGMWYSLGMLFGTAVVATVLVYFLGKMNFTKSIATWVETTINQIKWEKIFTPNSNVNNKIIEIEQIQPTATPEI